MRIFQPFEFEILETAVDESSRAKPDADSNTGLKRILLSEHSSPVIVIPSSLDESIWEIPLEDLKESRSVVHDFLGAHQSSHIFSSECIYGGKMYWIENSNEFVNERAAKLIYNSSVKGDALLICNQKKRKPTNQLNMNSLSFSELSGKSVQSSLSAHSTSINDLPPSVLLHVFARFGFSDLSSCSAVCHYWRNIIPEDTAILKNLEIKRRKVKLPESISNLPVKALKRHKTPINRQHRTPFILLQAAKAGNFSAAFFLGEELERAGEFFQAFDWFKKAARNGHQHSQFKIGEALYRGGHGWSRDEEEALSWLSRAFKNPTADKSICASSGLLIGYMHLDGEGSGKIDNTEAVKWLKSARDYGSLEAEKMLGWLWNTGQY